MALSVGCITLVDLRMLGLGLRSCTPAELVRETEWWTILGLTLAIVSGLLIFSTDPLHNLTNGPFQFKMVILSVALLYNYTLHRNVALAGSPSGPVVAVISILLWMAPVAAGIFIAFI